MGVVERRERERVEVRRRILDAARDLFAREGYEHVTMRRIAEAIEYSPTTIYHHFEDKDDLVKALCEEDFSRLFEALKQEAPPSDPLEAIKTLGLAYGRFALAYPNHYRFMFMTTNKSQQPDPTSPGHRSFDVLRSAVVRAIEAGSFRRGDPDVMAQVLWASLHGAVSLLITVEPTCWPCPPDADLVDHVIENSSRGFRAR